MSFLAVEDLQVRLDGFALRAGAFHLERGDYLAMLGPTGAGKTVFLNTIAGFHFAHRGQITLDGCDIGNLPPEQRGIGIVYQDYALFPHLTVAQNIAYGLEARLKDKDVIRESARRMAEAFGIGHLLQKGSKALSGGEQQRTALARALVTRPHLLLMDEPFAALDPHTRRELRRLVRKITQESGITVIHVAHDLEDTWALATKATVLEAGCVQEPTSVNGIFGPPAPSFLRHVQGVRVVHGTVAAREGGLTAVVAGGVTLHTADPAAPGESARVLIRPEDVTLYTEEPVGASARNVLECALGEIYRDGETCLVGLRTGKLEFNALLTLNAFEALGLSDRDSAFAAIKAVHLNLV